MGDGGRKVREEVVLGFEEREAAETRELGREALELIVRQPEFREQGQVPQPWRQRGDNVALCVERLQLLHPANLEARTRVRGGHGVSD